MRLRPEPSAICITNLEAGSGSQQPFKGDTNGVVLPDVILYAGIYPEHEEQGLRDPTRINVHVRHTVYLDQGRITDKLYVGPMGEVTPRQYGAIGIVSSMAGDSVSNAGKVIGGSSGHRSNLTGGVGISFASNGTLRNSGYISGGVGSSGNYTGNGGAGVILSAGGTVSNEGTISGGEGGSAGYPDSGASGGAGVVSNGGILRNYGVIDGGNGGSGFLNAGDGGIGVSIAGGALTNAGTISGGAGGDAEYIEAKGGSAGVGVAIYGGTLTNSGVISGAVGGQNYGDGSAGVFIDGGKVINAGTISLGGYYNKDAVQFGQIAATLVVEPGAVFNGGVAGNGTNDVLILAAASNAGTLSDLGFQFAGFTTIQVAANAEWTISGASTLASGSTLDAAGALTFAQNVSGNGSLVIDKHGTVTAGASLNGIGIDFDGRDASLVLDHANAVGSVLSGFGNGDTIDLVNLVANGVSFANGTLSLLENKTVVFTLGFAGTYSSNSFTLASDGNGGTTIDYVTGTLAIGIPALDFSDFRYNFHIGSLYDIAAPSWEVLQFDRQTLFDWAPTHVAQAHSTV